MLLLSFKKLEQCYMKYTILKQYEMHNSKANLLTLELIPYKSLIYICSLVMQLQRRLKLLV